MEQNWPQGFSIAIIRVSSEPSDWGGVGGALGGENEGRSCPSGAGALFGLLTPRRYMVVLEVGSRVKELAQRQAGSAWAPGWEAIAGPESGALPTGGRPRCCSPRPGAGRP